MAECDETRIGSLIAKALCGAWRETPPSLELSADQLNAVAPSLLGSGAGALAWRRVRSSPLKETPVALELRDAHRHHALQSKIHESGIKNAFAALRDGGIEPVLVKGWAAARLYPERGLRPYGDIDLCVPPGEWQQSKLILSSSDARIANVDLHRGVSLLDDCEFDELLARSVLTKLDETNVRVFGLEDELRMLCNHLLRHGAWRPLWLCDIAAAVESRAAEFDWDLCAGNNKRQADWIICTIGLAGALLEARIDHTPARGKPLPKWLAPAVLKQWATYPSKREPLARQRPMRSYVRRPSGALSALYKRWPDPITATASVKGSFNEWPRLPYQLGGVAVRVARFLTAW